MRVILADDHTLIRENLREFLTKLDRFVEVLEAATLEEALDQARQQKEIDLVLLDLMMPGMHGIAGVREMADTLPDSPIVVLSGSTRSDDVRGAIKLGAKAFVQKSVASSELIDVLRRVLSGESYVPDDYAEHHYSRQVEAASSLPAEEPEVFKRMTPRERDVLEQLVKGHVNKQIARNLGIEEITVKVHLQRLFKKLEVSNRTHAALKAVHLGWAATPDSGDGQLT